MEGSQLPVEVNGFGRMEHALLRSSLHRLSRLALAELTLEEVLLQVAELAVQVTGADGASVRLKETDRLDAVVSTTPLMAKISAMELRLGEGPGLGMAGADTIIAAGALASDPRWPRFGPRAVRLGIWSALSLPLTGDDGAFGIITLYASAKDAFDDDTERCGSIFADVAATVVGNAHALTCALRFTERLQASIGTRPDIDRAIGILMGRAGISAEEAFERLKKISQFEHKKLHLVATDLVEQARRAANRPPAAPGPVSTVGVGNGPGGGMGVQLPPQGRGGVFVRSAAMES